MSKPKIDGKAAVAAAGIVLAALIAGSFLFGNRIGGSGSRNDIVGTNNTSQAKSQQPDQTVTGIPDVNPEDYDYEQIYPSTFDEDPPLTTLTQDQAEQAITDFLGRLLALDPSAIEQVSERTYSGTYNPLRYMLDAVQGSPDMLQAFQNMGAYTEYEILGFSGDLSRSNSFTVYLTVTTPYMTLPAEELATSAEQGKYTPFQSTGAAQAIAGMNLANVEKGTDLISLRFLIEDDVPMLYGCDSYYFEDDFTVQYAFFWGGIKFFGTRDGDLLLNNAISGNQEMTQSSAMSADMDSILEQAKAGELDQLIERGAFREETKQDMYKIGYSLPESFDMEGLRKKYMETVQYNPKFFCDEIGDGVLELTWSFEDPYLEKKVIQHDYLFITGYFDRPSACDEISYALFSYFLEESYGGRATDLESRIGTLEALAEQ